MINQPWNAISAKKFAEEQAEKTKQTKTGRPYGRPKVERPANWNEIITLVNENKITKTEAMKRLNLKKNKFYEFYNSEKKK